MQLLRGELEPCDYGLPTCKVCRLRSVLLSCRLGQQTRQALATSVPPTIVTSLEADRDFLGEAPRDRKAADRKLNVHPTAT